MRKVEEFVRNRLVTRPITFYSSSYPLLYYTGTAQPYQFGMTLLNSKQTDFPSRPTRPVAITDKKNIITFHISFDAFADNAACTKPTVTCKDQRCMFSFTRIINHSEESLTLDPWIHKSFCREAAVPAARPLFSTISASP